MDCPSCARKIETAVNKVEGVVDAKVLFATEKLIISANHSGVASLVEQAILDTGFTFQTPTSTPKQPNLPVGRVSLYKIQDYRDSLSDGCCRNNFAYFPFGE